MYTQQIIDDITKYRNYNITFIKNNITHLYYRKYIFSIRVGGINYSCTKKEDYKAVMKKIKDAIQSFPKIRSIVCYVSAAESLEALDAIILQDKEKSKYGLNLPIKVYNRTPPTGSTKFRVKMTFHPHFRQPDLIDNMTNIIDMLKQSFGDDYKNSTYVSTNGIPAYRYSNPTVYINFKNEDDIIFMQPYTSLDRLQSIKLEVFDG
jgi:hypothetical protein